MTKRERIQQAVYEAIDELNGHLPKDQAIGKAEDAPLYGKGGKLESLDFVSLVVEVESKIQKEFDADFMLTDENLLSKETSPFATVGKLIEHLEATVDNE